MPFPPPVRTEALIACQRQCCLCHQRKHTQMTCHHIIPEADGGSDTFDNCIPLCPDCHAQVESYNPRHPFASTRYHPDELKRRRDDWYTAVARRTQELAINGHRTPLNYPHSPAAHGTVTFNYAHHDGFCRLGEGDYEFLTRWTKGSNDLIYCDSARTNISVALPPKNIALGQITHASHLHFGSRLQKPRLGQFVVLENHRTRYAAIKILKIHDDTRGHPEDFLQFEYWILPDGGDDFSALC